MKHTMKRGLSLVLALCMVLGMVVLPGVTEAKAEGETASSLISTPVYSHGMDYRNSGNSEMDGYVSGTHNVYLPLGWTYSNQNMVGSSIVTEGGRTYFKASLSADKNAASWGNYKDADNFDSTVALSYDFMVDNSAVTDTWTVYLPSFGTSTGSHTVSIKVTDNVLKYGNGSNTLTPGQWYNLVLILNETSVVVYLDGESFAQTEIDKNTLSYLVMGLVGSSSTDTKGLGFCLDDLKVYDFVAGTGFSADADCYSVAVNSTVATYWTKAPADAYLPSVTYTSSDDTVATVDENGVVTGLKDGTVTITATPAASSDMSAATTTVVVGAGEEEQPDLLKFSYAVPVLANDLAIEFQAKGELFGEGKYTNPTASFTFNGTTVNMPLTYNSQADLYVALFTGIAPHQMGDEITYTLSATYDGETVTSVANTYSMLQYCTNELENSPDAELEALLVSTLNYGAAAQTYSGYKTTSLVNARLTPEQQTVATRELAKVTSTGENNKEQQAVWKTATVILDNAVVTEFTFQSELSDLTVKINGSTDYVTVVAGADNMYTVYYEGLNAAQLSDSLTAVVYSGDEAVSSTLTYSVESCAYYHVNENADAGDALKALVKALVAYGDAASAFNN